jgi:hypothetical protein
MPGRRALSVLLALVGWAAAALVALGGLVWGLVLRCDESCNGDGWARGNDGWQWDGVAVLGAAVLVCGSAFVAFVWRRTRALAALTLAAGLAVTAALGTILSPDWLDHLDRRTGPDALPALAGIAAPLVALALTPPRRR